MLEGLGGPLSTEQREYLRIIVEKGDGLLQLISSLLDLSRIEAGRIEIKNQSVCLFQEITATLSVLSQQAEKKGLKLKVKYLGKLPTTLFTDPVRLRQILINILGNAIKFTEKGEVTLEVELCEAPQVTSGKLLNAESERRRQ